MKKDNPNTRIRWIITVISIVIVWQMYIPEFFHNLAIDIGATEDALLYHLIIKIGVPLLISSIVWLIFQLFSNLLWKLIAGKDYLGGWWVYSLIADTENETFEILGYFQVIHKPEIIIIEEGKAFYLEDSKLTYRGDWKSRIVSKNSNKIRVIFEMRSPTAHKESPPSNYDGYFEISRKKENPKVGINLWKGFFQDIGDRQSINGPLCAEKIKGKINGTKAKSIIEKNHKLIIENSKEQKSS